MVVYAIGLDLGGTNLKGGIVSEKGELKGYRLVPAHAQEGPDAVINALTDLSRELLAYGEKEIGANIIGIGVVSPGVIDTHLGGVGGGAYNLPGWCGTPFMKILSETLNLPIFAHNDVTATALGEWKFGAGREKKNLVMATFGTGIGGGIIIDNRLYNGVTGYSGEIGHMITHAGGYRCTCGSKGCWEEYASARGIVRIAKRILEKNREGDLYHLVYDEEKQLKPPIIFERAKEGDEIALRIVDRVGYETAVGIGSLINIFNPELFIVGGGIAKAGSIYLGAIKRHLPDLALEDARKAVKVVSAAFGYEAGIIGAASLVYEGINRYEG